MSRKFFPWILFPDQEVSRVTDIDFRSLRNSGKEAIIFDLDNTIARWGEGSVDQCVIELLSDIEDLGFKIGILSNGKRKNIESFVDKLPFPCQFNAQKPRRKYFRDLLNRMDVSPEKSVMIGDQLLTDVLGANRTSMYSIRVDPMEEGREYKFTKINRVGEKLLFSLRNLFRKIRDFRYSLTYKED